MYGKGNKCLLDLNKGIFFEFIFWCVRLVMAIIFALEIMGAYHDGLCGNVAWCWCASLNKYKIRFIGCNKNFITKEHLYLYVYIMF